MSDLPTSFGRVGSGTAPPVTAFVRVSGPPNSNFLVGYPGISATLVSSPFFVAHPGFTSIDVGGALLAADRGQG